MRLTEIEKEDVNHKATVWALSQPGMQQLCSDMYVTYNTKDDAERFEKSEEFKECLNLVRSRLNAKGLPALLDIGSGNGTASWSFAKNGFDVTSTDLCLSDVCGLEAAKNLDGHQGVTLRIVRGDAHRLDFPDASFDVVFCRQVLHHADDLPAFLHEIGRVLKPGGVFLATREQVAENDTQLKELLGNHPLNHITQDEKAFKRSEYLKAISAAGFSKTKVIPLYSSVINYFPATRETVINNVVNSFPRPLGKIALLFPPLYNLLVSIINERHESAHFTLDTYLATR
jgi:ubiquinone/menaquinone biosynthesis C-methylase UbiE